MNLHHFIGRIVCWHKSHHLDGHKFKLSAAMQLKHMVHGYGYQCSRCGRIRPAPLPIKRVKK